MDPKSGSGGRRCPLDLIFFTVFIVASISSSKLSLQSSSASVSTTGPCVVGPQGDKKASLLTKTLEAMMMLKVTVGWCFQVRVPPLYLIQCHTSPLLRLEPGLTTSVSSVVFLKGWCLSLNRIVHPIIFHETCRHLPEHGL